MSPFARLNFFVGGGFNGVKRQDEFLECRSLLTLDIDKYQGDTGGLEFDLDLSGWGAFDCDVLQR